MKIRIDIYNSFLTSFYFNMIVVKIDSSGHFVCYGLRKDKLSRRLLKHWSKF